MTNEEIDALSYYEINCMVAKAIGLESVMFFAPIEEVDPEFCTGPVWDVPSGNRHCGFISMRGNCFDPCNDPAVMMPIVFKSRINLLSPRDEEDEWAASWSSGGGEWLCFDVMYSHAKPLRAAAIVYLKSKGVL